MESLELIPERFVTVNVNVTVCWQSHADGAVYVVSGSLGSARKPRPPLAIQR
jgi:hypothetical protein